MKNLFAYIIFIIFSSSITLLHAKNEKLDRMLEQAKKEVSSMNAKKLKDLIDREKNVIVLDIRENNQKKDGYIYADETYEITRGDLEFVIEEKIPNKQSVIVTYCRGGSRSIFAAQALKKLGYKNANYLEGGMKAWANEGYPIETGLGITYLKTNNSTTVSPATTE